MSADVFDLGRNFLVYSTVSTAAAGLLSYIELHSRAAIKTASAAAASTLQMKKKHCSVDAAPRYVTA
jgi:hypothetical protein